MLFCRFLLFPSIAAVVFFTTACDFKPLYSHYQDKQKITDLLEVPNLPNKEGYHLREELIRQLGEPRNRKYILDIDITTTKFNEVITQNNEITSYKLIMTAHYSIKDLEGTKVLPVQKSLVRTGFSSAGNSTSYSTQIAEEAAKKRLAIKIADEISTRLLILSDKWIK